MPRHTGIRCRHGSVQARQGINLKDCTNVPIPSPLLYKTISSGYALRSLGNILCQHKDLGMGLPV